MKYFIKIVPVFISLLLLLSCGLINSEEEIDYDWYGEWERTDTENEQFLVLTADTMYTFDASLTSQEWENCSEYATTYPIVSKSEAAFTILLRSDPLYVGIESLSADLNSIILRFEGENETESYARTQIPETCTYHTSDTQ
jgi:hypothetical protein